MAARQEHEYSVVGHSRAVVGRYLGTIAAAVAGGVVFLVGSVINVAHLLGVADSIPDIIIWPLSAGTVWALLYWLFNTRAWKWGPISRAINVPDLSGEWAVEGTTLDQEQNPTYQWEGTITVVQSWEKLRVYLKTGTSSSHSLSAAVFCEPGAGYRLTYSYQNDPRVDQRELRTHVGFADVLFSEDLLSGEGDYFNNKGRVTYGVMRLKRKV